MGKKRKQVLGNYAEQMREYKKRGNLQEVASASAWSQPLSRRRSLGMR